MPLTNLCSTLSSVIYLTIKVKLILFSILTELGITDLPKQLPCLVDKLLRLFGEYLSEVVAQSSSIKKVFLQTSQIYLC